MLALYDYFRSSACFRVRITLNLKELPYHLIPIHLINNGGEQFSASYQNINPQSLVPTLKDEYHMVTQSLAIIEYLNELYPHPPLLPKDALAKAHVRAFALAIIADIHPLNNVRVLKYLNQELHVNDEQRNKWYQHWINKGFTSLEKILADQPAHDFCFGDSPTLADICLVPQMYNARRYACDLTAFPNLVRIDAHCQKQTAFMKAVPNEAVTA
jgi:maleylacetoacetate isomerase